MIEMTTDDLREQFGKENPKVCITATIADDFDIWTDDYVMWLEKQLLDIYNAK